LGPPGGGKGTISKRIVRDFGYHHISTGDMLRSHVREGTDLGHKAKEFMDAGGLVPDKLIIDMLMAKLQEVGSSSHVLLDGFPRTLEQAEALDRSSKVDMVLYLTVPREEITQRAADRWIHLPSGRTYSYKYSPPQAHGIDDETKEVLVQRDDDKPEAVTHRLGAFDQMTQPLLGYYSEKGVLAKFSGSDAPDLIDDDRRSDAIYQGLNPYLMRQHDRLKK
jgi:nucleoside-triphosphate--adenylate kinase